MKRFSLNKIKVLLISLVVLKSCVEDDDFSIPKDI